MKRGQMNIATIGKGNIGGGLGDLWEQAGHELTRLGHEGGDVSAAEVVLVAVPGGAVAEALERVSGIEGKATIEATNLYGNFALLFDRLGEAGSTPSNLWCGDEEVREAVEQLNRDAGYARPPNTGDEDLQVIGFFAGPEVQQHWSDEVWEPGDLTVTGSPNS
jgi:hypothetical protein